MWQVTTLPYKKDVPQAIRAPARPIIAPRSENAFWWERNGTFNPGVTEYHNQVVLLYRAYDDFRISRLGLAHSKDGITFTRYNNPVIDTDPNDPNERLGIEDPRITKIDDTYYILHTAASYNLIGSVSDISGVVDFVPWRVRIGMHTTKNFKQYIHHDVILPDIPAKNGCLIPEKINGSFGVYYRQQRQLKVAFTKDFINWSDIQEIDWPVAEPWQSAKFGIGSPPFITSDGYLLIYHAVDALGVYRLGLMMFDRQNPSQLLWYSGPVLEPELPFEKEGYIRNVVYTCGGIIRNNELWIYYGGADKVIARAILPLTGLLTGMRSN